MVLLPTWSVIHSAFWKAPDTLPGSGIAPRSSPSDRIDGNGRYRPHSGLEELHPPAVRRRLPGGDGRHRYRPGHTRLAVLQGPVAERSLPWTRRSRCSACSAHRAWPNHSHPGCHERRLQHHRAGRHMDYATTTPADIAGAIEKEIGGPTDYRPVETDGAARAAALMGEVL
ncbi:MAG: hypothetical protein WKF73_04680 [Nocardioidaceae bacterium]